MQRESNLIATIRKKVPDFAKACADESELVLLHQDAFAIISPIRAVAGTAFLHCLRRPNGWRGAQRRSS
jgi:hypothetical protein